MEIVHFIILHKLLIHIGVIDSSYTCDFHTGVDIVARTDDKTIYPCEAGTVVYTNNTAKPALGVQCQVRGDSGRYWRYCHMVLNSLKVGVGQRVDLTTPIGTMGATGKVSGPHLHLECSNVQAWQCNQFVNPCAVLGIPNKDNLIIYYNGAVPPDPDPPDPDPPDPDPPKPANYREKKFNWVYYARKLRGRRNE